MPKATTSKADIVIAIQGARRKLKRTPTRAEFQSITRIHWTKVQRLFGGYRVAVRAAGLEPDRGGLRIETTAMLRDFGRVARKLKRHPTRDEYEKLGEYASASLETRFDRWSRVREKFLECAERKALEGEWDDVMESLRGGPIPRRGGGKNWLKPKEALPQINADKRRSESMDLCVEQVRPKILLPELRGMRCVTRTMLWVLCENRKPLKHRGTGETEEGLPRIHADDHGSEAERNSPQIHGEPGQVSADQYSCVGPVRPDIALPELRGMRCVTRTMLWVLFENARFKTNTLKHRGEEDAEGNKDKAFDRQDWKSERRGCGAESSGRGPEVSGLLTRAGFHGHTAAAVAAIAGQRADAPLDLYFPRRAFPGRPMMGAPLRFSGLAFEPVNEMGVVFLFGVMAYRLGFWVEALQASFPDCEAKLEVEPGRWQHVRIEFEYESRKFRDHRHDPEKCDMIVCWRHNWAGCPESIQVVELGRMLQSPRSRVIAT